MDLGQGKLFIYKGTGNFKTNIPNELVIQTEKVNDFCDFVFDNLI